MARTYHAGEGGKRGAAAPAAASDGSRRGLNAVVPMRVVVMAQMVRVMPEMMAMAPLRPECARGHQHQQ
jgi:hypothetical protein